MRTYKSYVFRGKDPAIAALRGVIERGTGNRLAGSELGKIEKAGGPSTAAMRSWFWGKTKRPQNATLEAAGRALGFERVWKPMKNGDAS